MGRRKEVLVGCGMYGNCSLCVPFPFLACFFLLTPFPVPCWRKQQTYLGSCHHTVREEAQESAGVAFRNTCLMSGLVQMNIFSGQSQRKRVLPFPFPCSCGSFIGHFHIGFCCCCSCIYAVSRSSML